MATSTSFNSLVDRGSYVQSVAASVERVLKQSGYAARTAITARPPSYFGEDTDIHIRLTKDGHDTTARITLRRSAKAGGFRVHEVEGLPDEVRDLIFDVPKDAIAKANAAGVQAHPKNNPAAAGPGGALGGARPANAAAGERVADPVVGMALSLIDLAVVRKELESRRTRRYIGASGIGETCQAYQALSLRGYESDMPSPKMLRIFREGHRIEEQVVEDLKAAGHYVLEKDPATGEQWEYTSHGGHHVCHLDGFIRLLGNTDPALFTLEVKSMQTAMFGKFMAKGVKVSHPEYYDQCIDQLGLVRMQQAKANVELSMKCFFVAYCKENSKYHAEVVEFDQAHFDKVLDRARAAMNGEATRESAYEKAFKCSGSEHMDGCFKRTACWHTEKVTEPNCWHCAHAIPATSGKKDWWCTTHAAPAIKVCGDFKPFKVKPHGSK